MDERLTSLKVFRRYFVTREDGSLDASRLLSRECYLAWRDSRKKEIPSPETQFQRSLSSHVTSLDGRVPFTEAEEVAVLREVRKRRVWACFEHSDKKVGMRGFASIGFHEKRRLGVGGATGMGQATESQPQQKRVKHQEEDAPAPSFPHPQADNSPFPLQQFLTTTGNSVRSMTYAEIAAHANPDYLVQLLERMTSMVTASPVDRWKALFMFSMEWTRQVIAHADRTRIPQVIQWVETQTARVTDWVVVVIDSMTKTYHDRYVAQNDNATRILGNLVGKPDALFRKDDLIMLVILTGASYNNPGREFPVQFHLKCKDGVERQFDMRFYVDPITALGILRAKLIE